MVTVSEDAFQPYNGTVFNLTGVLQLDTSIVNTDVIVTWVWSLDGQELDRQNTFAPLHEITISFNPLTTNSSGLYSLHLIVDPIDTTYVAGNINSTTYNLSVQSEFLKLITYQLIKPFDTTDFPFI